MTNSNNIKKQMGYMSSSQRPMCGNCCHVEEHWEDRMPRDIVTFSCRKAGFTTTKTALCFEWISKHDNELESSSALSAITVCKMLIEATDSKAIDTAKDLARKATAHITGGTA